MPWQIGIDEAGYGPNLGPLVMCATACRTTEPQVDLWRAMRATVRRHDDEDNGRMLVADSKLVYTPARGLRQLECGVLAFLFGGRWPPRRDGVCVRELLEAVCSSSHKEMTKECWYHGSTRLPLAASGDDHHNGVNGWRRTSEARGLEWGLAAGVLVVARRFNQTVDKRGSKGFVLGLGLAELLHHCLRLPGDDALDIVVDKHGGRNFYCDVLQHAFEEGMVLAREEGAELSVYEIVGLGRPVRVRFMPRADATAFCVALASMLAKYLREVLMHEFNGFWTSRVPGLAPTAGYPGDSARFFEAIQGEMTKLGLTRERVWRER